MTWHAKCTINGQAAWTPMQKAKVASTLRLWSQLHRYTKSDADLSDFLIFRSNYWCQWRFEASKRPRNRFKPVWMNQETTARGPIEHDFLDESAESSSCDSSYVPSGPFKSWPLRESQVLGTQNEGTSSWMFQPSIKPLFHFAPWTFRPCTRGAPN